MPDDRLGLPEADLKRDINVRARLFEEEVADLFRLLGYKATVDVKDDDTQVDVVLEKSDGIFTTRALVECKNWTKPVDQNEVRYFGIRVEEARRVDRFSQAILVARSGFRNHCHAVAKKFDVTLLTFRDLLRKLFDLGPHMDDSVRTFEGSALQRLYVEQDVVLQSDLRPGEVVTPKPQTAAVREWIAKDDGTLLTLLGDFGSGKTSFCRCLAYELARDARADPKGAKRSPFFVDLREGGSTTPRPARRGAPTGRGARDFESRRRDAALRRDRPPTGGLSVTRSAGPTTSRTSPNGRSCSRSSSRACRP